MLENNSGRENASHEAPATPVLKLHGVPGRREIRQLRLPNVLANHLGGRPAKRLRQCRELRPCGVIKPEHEACAVSAGLVRLAGDLLPCPTRRKVYQSHLAQGMTLPRRDAGLLCLSSRLYLPEKGRSDQDHQRVRGSRGGAINRPSMAVRQPPL